MGANAGMCILALGLWFRELGPEPAIMAFPMLRLRRAGSWIMPEEESRWEIELEEEEVCRPEG